MENYEDYTEVIKTKMCDGKISFLFFLYSSEVVISGRGEKKMEGRLDPSTLEYVLKLKKVEVASCEAISHALEFEGELNAWMDEIEIKRKEEVEEDE